MRCITHTVRVGAHTVGSPIVVVSNPDLTMGDQLAGRHAFVALQCVDCHRVAEDPALPRGRRAIAGPMLSDLNRFTPRTLAHRITSSSTGASESLLDRTMKDYTQPMTARQLVDVVAYLRDPRIERD